MPITTDLSVIDSEGIKEEKPKNTAQPNPQEESSEQKRAIKLAIQNLLSDTTFFTFVDLQRICIPNTANRRDVKRIDLLLTEVINELLGEGVIEVMVTNNQQNNTNSSLPSYTTSTNWDFFNVY